MHTSPERRSPLVSVPTAESTAIRNGMTRLTIQDMLAEARSHLIRLRPTEAQAAVREGALLVDPLAGSAAESRHDPEID